MEPQKENDSVSGICLSGITLFVAPDGIPKEWIKDGRGMHERMKARIRSCVEDWVKAQEVEQVVL